MGAACFGRIYACVESISYDMEITRLGQVLALF